MKSQVEAKSRILLLMRAGVLACAAVVLCWPLTVGVGIFSAAAGCIAGALLGDRLSRSRIRLPGAFLIALLSCVVLVTLSRILVIASFPAGLAGPMAAFRASEAILWLGVLAPVAFLLRFAAARHRVMAIFEVVAVGVSLASSLAAHRDGMVHRPFVLSDWAWSIGVNPVVIFLILGGVGALVLAAMLISEDRRRRLPLHFAILVVLGILIMLMVHLTGTPQQRTSGDLGLTGKPNDQQKGSSGKQGSTGGAQGNASGSSGSRSSEQMGDLQFKDEYSQSGGNGPVAVVILHGDYSPPSGVYYLRQTAFSQFNGTRLVQATRDDVDRDVVAQFPETRLSVPDAPPASSHRMSLETTVGLLTDHVRPFALDSPVEMWPAENPDEMQIRRAYGVRSSVPTLAYDKMLGHRAGDPAWNDDQWKHYTDCPKDPRYGQLASEILGVLKPEYRSDPLAEAFAVKMWLDKNGIYSLKSKHADETDPTASFLFGDRTGYCVHFAHAAAFLLRTLGVPTRVAAGYAIEEGARGSGSTIMVRARDAHAWPEVRIDGVGWVVVDPQPERSLEPPTEAPDQDLQRMLGQMMRKSQGQQQPQLPRPGPIDSRTVARRLLALAIVAMLLAYLTKMYRALAPHFVSPAQLYRVSYRAALDRLAEGGFRRRPGETRERFGERVRPLSPSFAPLTGSHLGGALGSTQAADAEWMRKLSAAVGQEVRAGAPAWRWLIGALNPISWTLVR